MRAPRRFLTDAELRDIINLPAGSNWEKVAESYGVHLRTIGKARQGAGARARRIIADLRGDPPPTPPQRRWTPERIATLAEMWRSGSSATTIARTLGDGFSRSAIIGEVHREQAKARKNGTPDIFARPASDRDANRRAAQPRTPRQARPPRSEIVVAPPPKPAPTPDIASATIYQLNDRTCRWPMGEDYCGSPRVRGAYCRAHGDLAYQPRSTVNAKGVYASIRRFL